LDIIHTAGFWGCATGNHHQGCSPQKTLTFSLFAGYDWHMDSLPRSNAQVKPPWSLLCLLIELPSIIPVVVRKQKMTKFDHLEALKHHSAQAFD
jgi:hypothetical protein